MYEKGCFIVREGMIGPCGPSSFINALELKGSLKLARELSEIGRMKPSKASDFTSFLIWSEKYKIKDIKIFVENLKVPDGFFKLFFRYEHIPKKDQKRMKIELIKNHSNLVKRYRKKIRYLRGDPVNKINFLLNKGYTVIYFMADYFGGPYLISHVRVIWKREKERYFVKDSYFGNLVLSKNEVIKGIKNLERIGSRKVIVGLKKNN